MVKISRSSNRFSANILKNHAVVPASPFALMRSNTNNFRIKRIADPKQSQYSMPSPRMAAPMEKHARSVAPATVLLHHLSGSSVSGPPLLRGVRPDNRPDKLGS